MRIHRSVLCVLACGALLSLAACNRVADDWKTAQAADSAGQQSQTTLPPGAFFSLSQLYSIPGVAAADIDKFLPLIGLYSKDGKINPMAAPLTVLQSIPNITPEQIGLFQQARESGRADGQALKQLVQQLNKFITLDEPKSFVVAVRGVSGPNVISGSRLTAVIALGGDAGSPYRVMSWSW